MASGGFDPKESLIEAFYAAKELAEGLLADFKSSDRFFKYKAGIIATWAFLSITTAAVACPGSGAPQNKLMARALVEQVVDETSVAVINDSTSEWKDVKITLNHTFTAFQASIPASGRAVLTLKQFSGANGAAVPAGTKPNLVTVICSEGTTEIDLNAPPATP
jgi:hypothetical protein